MHGLLKDQFLIISVFRMQLHVRASNFYEFKVHMVLTVVGYLKQVSKIIDRGDVVRGKPGCARTTLT